MAQFNSDSFAKFIGSPTIETNHVWGIERRYVIERNRVLDSIEPIRDTLYYHHSSFDIADNLNSLGYSATAELLKRKRAGLPQPHDTRMGNLAEVLGTEYVRWILGFESAPLLAKRFNPNIDQSMKGIDVVGIQEVAKNIALLQGEAKCYQKFSASLVTESYKHLTTLWKEESRKAYLFAKEILKLQGNKVAEALIDRIYYPNLNPLHESTLILIITQNRPRDPFRAIENLALQQPLPRLTATHVQIKSLKELLPFVFEITNT